MQLTCLNTLDAIRKESYTLNPTGVTITDYWILYWVINPYFGIEKGSDKQQKTVSVLLGSLRDKLKSLGQLAFTCCRTEDANMIFQVNNIQLKSLEP